MDDIPAPEVITCINTWDDPCELLNCLFGFNAPLDPLLLGYGRDEIEIIASNRYCDWAENILLSALTAGIIPDYREGEIDPVEDCTGAGCPCTTCNGGDGGGGPGQPTGSPAFLPVLTILGVASWLLGT